MTLSPRDAAIVEAVSEPGVCGGRTFKLRNKLVLAGWNMSRATLMRRLRFLEKAGLVKEHPRYSAENDTYWVPADYVEVI